MPSIFSGLNNALGALHAQQYALDITQRNIANVNTPGYSRQRVNFAPGAGDASLGASVPSVSVQSFRDRFIDYRIAQELPSQGENEALSQALQQVDGILNPLDGKDLQDALTAFFNSFGALANSPADLSLRQNVLSQAGVLTTRFHQVYDRIQNIQLSQDRAVSDTVGQINDLTSQIAALNAKVAEAQGMHSDSESALRDQRQELLDKLSSLADVSYFETESGSVTVTTGQGALLVIADQNARLTATTVPNTNMTQIVLDGQIITSHFQSGKLGGLLKARDQMLAGYLSTLDDMAAELIFRVNEQHALGTDLNGNDGGDFFSPFVPTSPTSNEGAASGMSMVITDPRMIAAAASGAGPGSNANARALAGISDEPLSLSGNATLIQCYASILSRVGSDYGTADDAQKTQTQVLLQLQNQRESLAGVNLDEEATNIILYQKAYEASARLTQVWNSLADEVLKFVGA